MTFEGPCVETHRGPPAVARRAHNLLSLSPSLGHAQRAARRRTAPATLEPLTPLFLEPLNPLFLEPLTPLLARGAIRLRHLIGPQLAVNSGIHPMEFDPFIKSQPASRN